MTVPPFLFCSSSQIYIVTNNFEDRVVVLTPDLSRLRDHRFALLVDDAEVVEEGQLCTLGDGDGGGDGCGGWWRWWFWCSLCPYLWETTCI